MGSRDFRASKGVSAVFQVATRGFWGSMECQGRFKEFQGDSVAFGGGVQGIPEGIRMVLRVSGMF